MKGSYPAVLTPIDSGGYMARVPDIDGCITTGDSIKDALSNVEDALSGCMSVLERFGIVPPASNHQSADHRCSNL